jgi:uncharacterized membrane protein (UPF0127 family)
MQQVLIYNPSRPEAGPIRARFCDTFLTRLRGWMFSKQIQKQEAIILADNKDSRFDAAIHMFFMNFDLAVVWVNQDMLVVDVCYAKRWRPFYMPKAPARFIIEAHPERLTDFKIGDRLIFENVS